MRTSIFVVILGLLAVVHSTPVTTVTQIPDDDIRGAVMEGFLVEHSSIPLLTTESPKRNTTVQASQPPSSDSTQSDMMEGSGEESTTPMFLQLATTTQNVSHTQSSSTDYPSPDYTSPSSFITLSVPSEDQASVTTDHTSVSTTTDPAVTRFHFLSTQSTTQSADLGSGDGDGVIFGQFSTTTSSTTSSSNTDTSTASSTSSTTSSSNTDTSTASSSSTAASPKVPVVFARSNGFGSGSGSESESESGSGPGSGSGSGEESGSGVELSTMSTTTEETKTQTTSENPTPSGGGSGSGEGSGMELTTTVPQLIVPRTVPQELAQPPQEPLENKLSPPENKGHSTSGWIIIVGFIVGVAALVLLCVAIATRDKWNGPRPSKASQLETKTNSSNQQRELEMETFLHQEKPRENGKAAEYTVIPLDELPEKHSSH